MCLPPSSARNNKASPYPPAQLQDTMCLPPFSAKNSKAVPSLAASSAPGSHVSPTLPSARNSKGFNFVLRASRERKIKIFSTLRAKAMLNCLWAYCESNINNYSALRAKAILFIFRASSENEINKFSALHANAILHLSPRFARKQH